MKRRTEVRETISPGKPLRQSLREEYPPLVSLVSKHPIASVETSGAYRFSPTRKLVRLPVSSPREAYREDLEKLHHSSPIRHKTQLQGAGKSLSASRSETRDTINGFSPQPVRKRLRFEDEESSPLRESRYSAHISSRISEAKDVLDSLRMRPSLDRTDLPSDAVRNCLEELKTATAALGRIGEVMERTAEILATSAKFLDGTVSQISTPNYYRRHEYPHNHRLLRSPY